MHDHSRFQRDIDDVTGVSFSLSLSLLLIKVTHAQYRKRFCASYYRKRGSASYIVREVHSERERERYRERERERERRK